MAEASILRDALVYLGAAVICVPLAKRARLGSVLGYLIAGCLIGPWGLGFVTNVQSILHFAEFGVVLMVGGSIPGETRTVAIAIYDRVQAFDNAGAGAMSLLLLALSLLALSITYGLSARVGKRHG